MELIEIAQLVTGLATLIVASVLIWQMIIQKKTLDIAHNDADSNLSLTAVGNKMNLNTWFAENSTPELLDKLNKGLDSMTPKEKRVIEAYTENHIFILTTEYRLGRMDRNPIYFRNNSRRILNNKASLEVYKLIRLSTERISAGKGLVNIVDEVYEELSGEKLELKK
tara:strand:+ start:388 stop:888 length:501 start_codon:yes stop_codon:yes gene_type:complete